MKIILLLLLLSSTSLIAQDIWNEYILGRPMQGYAESREATAKKWAINHKVILGGCIVNDGTQKTMEDIEKDNQTYLEKVAKKYGTNWLNYFNQEASIARLKLNNYVKGKWYDPVLVSTYDKELYQKKQQLAESWGLDYEFILVEDPSKMTAEQSEKAALGHRYIQQISGTLGENWVQKFDAVFARIQQKHQPTINDAWQEYLLEEVDEKYYQTKKEVLGEWGIKYEPHFVHCCKNKEQKMKAGNYAQKAATVKEKINRLFGQDWQEALEIEIQKRLPW